MKIFATFLPQFHQIEENDKWWGKGFTEWTNVKKALPLFKKHIQPKHPLNNNYYNLLDKETVVWQTKLMHEYGIEGFMYYHYYFNGKLIMEKPAENLLKWKEIEQPFFFCWANHKWVKTKKNVKETLIDMEYGNIDVWEKHFSYLLPFFKDNRYEKNNNCPLFMIFRPLFPEKNKMIEYFDKRCKEEGFNGICLIESFDGGDIKLLKNRKSEQTKFFYYREPTFSQNTFDIEYRTLMSRLAFKIRALGRKCGLYHKPRIYDGKKLIDLKLKRDFVDDEIIHGICFEWDNTPRHKERGYIITPFSENDFQKYMKKIQNDEYFIINAWNEWCEGMMLEPTEEEGYKYLEWIRHFKEMNNQMR